MYYIGIDGGGTKTIFCLFKENIRIQTIELTTCHFAQVGFDGCANILKQGIDCLLERESIKLSEVIIGAGIAGYGNDSKLRLQIKEAIVELMPHYQIHLTNDIHIALLGTLGGQDGITIIDGTGAIAMAKVGDRIERIGGWGYQLGDEGSGYWIGKQMLSEFTKQADGRTSKTKLYQAIKEHFKLSDDYQIIAFINNCQNIRTEIARLAKLCDTLAKDEDPVCLSILDKAAYEISLFVEGLRKHYQNKPLVSYYGSVFNSEIFLKNVQNYLEDITLMTPEFDALYGAYLFVLENIKN
ncbi:MAG: N-acetylglucosamine kinase [Coprobacillaceae bacterium]